MVNLLAGLVAYTYQEKKPSLDIHPKDLPALPAAAFQVRRTHVKTGEYVQTILLVNISLISKNKIICDHMWFNYGKQMQSLNLKLGDEIEFDARVTTYLKTHICNFFDYGLSYPNNILKIERSKPQKQESPLLMILTKI